MEFELYKHLGQYRWRLKAKNGEIIAISSEGYTTKANCKAGMVLTMDTTRQTPWYDLTGEA